MGFLDKLRGKKNDVVGEIKNATDETRNEQPPSGKRVKKYTSEGKPVYE